MVVLPPRRACSRKSRSLSRSCPTGFRMCNPVWRPPAIAATLSGASTSSRCLRPPPMSRLETRVGDPVNGTVCHQGALTSCSLSGHRRRLISCLWSSPSPDASTGNCFGCCSSFAPVPEHRLPVLGLCLRPQWMQPSLLFSTALLSPLVRVAHAGFPWAGVRASRYSVHSGTVVGQPPPSVTRPRAAHPCA